MKTAKEIAEEVLKSTWCEEDYSVRYLVNKAIERDREERERHIKDGEIMAKVGEDAIGELEAVRAENTRLREALKPFAEWWARYELECAYLRVSPSADGCYVKFERGDMRRAVEALNGSVSSGARSEKEDTK